MGGIVIDNNTRKAILRRIQEKKQCIECKIWKNAVNFGFPGWKETHICLSCQRERQHILYKRKRKGEIPIQIMKSISHKK